MQVFETVRIRLCTVNVPGAKVTTSGKAHARATMGTISRAVRQRSHDKNARALFGEDHSASSPDTVKARLRTTLHADCQNAVEALTPRAPETRKAKVVPIAEAPAWECTSNEAVVVPDSTTWLFREA